jgi:hypothetical protein
MVEEPKKSPGRTFGVVAREASRVVLLRRGPSKQVLCITWDTAKHEFRAGQWFKGRIYEHRCDLSPKGDKLIYLAADNRPPLYAWTAISRPPFLTALALWRNLGTWGGSGLFESDRRILLNSVDPRCELEKDFRLPKDIAVSPIGEWAGHGEDDPISSVRMRRDGWTLLDAGKVGEYKNKGPVSWIFERPELWRKPLKSIALERRTLAIGARNGPNYVVEHRLFNDAGEILADFGLSEWADWSRSDELLLSKQGRIFRVVIKRNGMPSDPDELIDLRELKFEAVEPPPDATRWNGKEVRGKRIT